MPTLTAQPPDLGLSDAWRFLEIRWLKNAHNAKRTDETVRQALLDELRRLMDLRAMLRIAVRNGWEPASDVLPEIEEIERQAAGCLRGLEPRMGRKA